MNKGSNRSRDVILPLVGIQNGDPLRRVAAVGAHRREPRAREERVETVGSMGTQSLRRQRLAGRTLPFGALILLAGGCADRPVGPSNPESPAQSVAVANDSTPAFYDEGVDLDAQWARVASTDVPGFAGYWREPDGRYTVALTSRGNERQAEDFVRASVDEGREETPVESRVVTFDFSQLYAWKIKLLSQLAKAHVYWLDVDETSNQLVFGVADSSAGAAVLQAADSAGVPLKAVGMLVTERPVERTSVGDLIRPVVGGLQISSGAVTCTLGFNATRAMDNGFVTASHCSTIKFATDGTVQYQNASPNRIGLEISDPGGSRLSDAALYRYDAGISRDWGLIARTAFPAVNARGSLAIDDAHPRFRITSEANNATQAVGELVNKVGRTSGWTQGQVLRTCVTLENLPCQWEARVWSEHGDSGSPMFQQKGPLEPDASRVALWGVLWGGPPADWTTTWYSTISGVKQDLGSLATVCDSLAATCYPPVYAVITGVPTIKRAGWYTYTVNAAHGDGTYSYSWQKCDYYGYNCSNQGSGTSVSLYFQSGDPSVRLRCTVTSAGHQHVAAMTIQVLF